MTDHPQEALPPLPEPDLFSHELLSKQEKDFGQPNGIHLGVSKRGICEQAYDVGETSEQIDVWFSPAKLRAYAEAAVARERERIANLWAGCTTDAEGHGLVDIGASIRAGRLIDEGP